MSGNQGLQHQGAAVYDVTRAIRDVTVHVRQASNAVGQLDTEQRLKPRHEIPTDEEQEAEESLDYHLRQIYRILQTCLFALGLDEIAAELKSEYTAFRNPLKLRFLDSIGELVSEPLALLESYASLLRPYLPNGEESGDQLELSWKLTVLLRILKGTPKIIFDSRLEPSNEAEVKRAIRNTLLHPFPDVTGEFALPKALKSFRPDFGIPSLKTAIEYKFVTTEAELKTVVGGIFEDMIGYSGNADWQRFYAVVYMTESFATEDQIISNFGAAKTTEPWTIVPVTGTGKRQKAKGKASKRAKRRRAS